MSEPDFEPCSEGCRGWVIDDEVQRCDECNRFESDEEAQAFVNVLLREHYAWLAENEAIAP